VAINSISCTIQHRSGNFSLFARHDPHSIRDPHRHTREDLARASSHSRCLLSRPLLLPTAALLEDAACHPPHRRPPPVHGSSGSPTGYSSLMSGSTPPMMSSPISGSLRTRSPMSGSPSASPQWRSRRLAHIAPDADDI
jgi:hypothetical protein